jgi:hypothetical protein
MSSPSDRPVELSERKKAKTRAAIHLHALRLFQEQGYSPTTVDQLAASTAPPGELSPIAAIRMTLRAPDDSAVRTWAGDVVGVALSPFLSVVDSQSMNFIDALNRGFALLEEGLPL